MNQIPKGSIIALAVFLIAVGGVWLLAGGGPGGSSQGQVPDEGPARSEDTGDKSTPTPDAAGEPEGGSGGGLTSVPADNQQAYEEPYDPQRSGQGVSPAPSATAAQTPSDPLGMRAEAEKANREGGERAGVAGGQRAVAASYVLYAYGYSGDDRAEYEYNLSPYIDPTPFYGSPGGERVEEHAASISEGSVRSAAELKSLRKLADEDEGRQRWLLKFAIGEEFAAGSEGVTGDVTVYEQEVVLVPTEDSWRVYEAGPLQPQDDNESKSGG